MKRYHIFPVMQKESEISYEYIYLAFPGILLMILGIFLFFLSPLLGSIFTVLGFIVHPGITILKKAFFHRYYICFSDKCVLVNGTEKLFSRKKEVPYASIVTLYRCYDGSSLLEPYNRFSALPFKEAKKIYGGYINALDCYDNVLFSFPANTEVRDILISKNNLIKEEQESLISFLSL